VQILVVQGSWAIVQAHITMNSATAMGGATGTTLIYQRFSLIAACWMLASHSP
jgi:hypothetical protein